MKENQISVGSRTIELSHHFKVFFPDSGITKKDVAEYYRDVAEYTLPHIRGRAITMHRFPDGINGEDFYHKEVPDYFPEWIKRASLRKKEGGTITHVVCENAATLVYLANQACITPHIWLSRVDKPTRPDRIIFDLDPPDDEFSPLRSAARALKELLEEIGLNSYLMTTGSRGLHVLVPLKRDADFDTVRTFARDIAEVLVTRLPDSLTMEQRKNRRNGKIFVDILRNAYAQTTPIPYAVRAVPGAPVATPLDWHELSDSGLHSRKYTIKNLFRRLGRKEDPWKGVGRHGRSLKKPQQALEELRSNLTNT
jgi:bifunctional non-homologous end joining protein LigD